ncbi:MAG: alpha/beta hydrolase [Acidobacteria bacterium]|nr:alpha/beta hydrolase [Acidobacteriota bacterium]
MTRLVFVTLVLSAAVLTQPPVEHANAEVNGVRLHYAKSGSGQLMIFLHGFPEFWYAWKNQLDEFGRDHFAVAPDMRGYNLSSKPDAVDQYRMPLLIEDVRALAAHLGFGVNRKFILVGHDWGGVVAWAYAAAHPESLERLIIVNAPHPTIFGRELRDNPAQQKASAYMTMFRSPEAEKTLSANGYQLLVGIVLGEGLKQGHITEADKAAYLEAWSQPGALTGGLNYYRAAQLGPASPASSPTPSASASASVAGGMTAGVVKVPTLVIWGEKDTALLTGNLNGLEAVVPQLTVKRIPLGSHWVVHEQPEQVNRYIRDFIDSQK